MPSPETEISNKDWTYYFSRGTSDIDWCEDNYVVTESIAEFWNTVSNVLFFVYPPLLIIIYWKYVKRDQWSHLVWAMLIMIGIGSTYFHATLSLSGQLLDEICILWLLIAAIGTWLPEKYLTPRCRTQKRGLRVFLFILVILLTILSFAKPAVNAFALLLSGIPITYIVIREVKQLKSQRAYSMGVRIVVMWVLAVTVWLSDKFNCQFWRSVHFPYLHSIWHILVSMVGYQACVLMSYIYAISDRPQENYVLRFWPRDSYSFFGVPFVSTGQVTRKQRVDIITTV